MTLMLALACGVVHSWRKVAADYAPMTLEEFSLWGF